jgi:hypothetical protein
MNLLDYEKLRRAFIEDLCGTEEISISMSFMASPIADRACEVVESDYSLDLLLDQAKKAPSLGAYIRAKAHRCDRVTYRAAAFEQGQISRHYWSRLLNDDIRASKEKLLRVALLLELSRDEADEMLEIAGYTMSPAILRDVVIQYCLEQHIYDFTMIEKLLEDHEIQSLFNDRQCS